MSNIKKIKIQGIDHVEEIKEVKKAYTQRDLLGMKENIQKVIAGFQEELAQVEAKLALFV